MEANGASVDSVERQHWKIIHVPEKPFVSPHHQPTGSYTDYWQLYDVQFQCNGPTTMFFFAVNVLAAEIEPKHANTLVRYHYHIQLHALDFST